MNPQVPKGLRQHRFEGNFIPAEFRILHLSFQVWSRTTTVANLLEASKGWKEKDEYSRPQKGLKLGDLCNKYLVRHQSDVPRPPRVNEGKQEVGTGIKKWFAWKGLGLYVFIQFCALFPFRSAER